MEAGRRRRNTGFNKNCNLFQSKMHQTKKEKKRILQLLEGESTASPLLWKFVMRKDFESFWFLGNVLTPCGLYIYIFVKLKTSKNSSLLVLLFFFFPHLFQKMLLVFGVCIPWEVCLYWLCSFPSPIPESSWINQERLNVCQPTELRASLATVPSYLGQELGA